MNSIGANYYRPGYSRDAFRHPVKTPSMVTATGWITGRYPLDRFAEAWADVQNKRGIKTVIEMP